jgi:hypothetical protein
LTLYPAFWRTAVASAVDALSSSNPFVAIVIDFELDPPDEPLLAALEPDEVLDDPQAAKPIASTRAPAIITRRAGEPR